MAIIIPNLALLRATVNVQAVGSNYFDRSLVNDVTGAIKSRRLSPPRWPATLQTHDGFDRATAAAWETLLLRLDGQVNQLALHDIKYPAPRGTVRGTLTLASTLAIGATSMTINVSAGQVGRTLLTGDRLGFGSLQTTQMVVVTADAVVSAGNQITVQFMHAARGPHSIGAAITWDKPVALFRQTQPSYSFERRPGLNSGVSIPFLEAWDL